MVRKKVSPSANIKRKQLGNSIDKTVKKQKDVTKSDSIIKKKSRKENMQVIVQFNPRLVSISKKAYKDITRLQMTTKNLLPRLSFQRVVREIMQGFCTTEMFRIQTEALRALQEAAEMYMTQYFEDAYFCCMHAKRKTLYVSDMQCVRRLRGRNQL